MPEELYRDAFVGEDRQEVPETQPFRSRLPALHGQDCRLLSERAVFIGQSCQMITLRCDDFEGRHWPLAKGTSVSNRSTSSASSADIGRFPRSARQTS